MASVKINIVWTHSFHSLFTVHRFWYISLRSDLLNVNRFSISLPYSELARIYREWGEVRVIYLLLHFYFFLYFLQWLHDKIIFSLGGACTMIKEFSLWIVNFFTTKCFHLSHSMLFALNSFCLIWLLYFIFVFPIMYVTIVLFSISFSFLCFRSYFLRICAEY